jgi:hypothetical protein
MPRSPQSRQNGGKAAVAEEEVSHGAVDLGLALSIYGKREDGSLVEIGNPASPLAHQSAAGTWPTEQ